MFCLFPSHKIESKDPIGVGELTAYYGVSFFKFAQKWSGSIRFLRHFWLLATISLQDNDVLD